jgi:uncharacterized membrane protein YecN with MAPEG domain
MTPILPVVSALTAGVLIIMQMVLLATVVGTRRRAAQSLGDGGKDEVLRVSRRHGNFAENAAIFVAALTLMEMLGGARWNVEALAALFVASRLLHAIGLSQTNTVNVFRITGVIGTVLAGIGVGARLLMLAANHL